MGVFLSMVGGGTAATHRIAPRAARAVVGLRAVRGPPAGIGTRQGAGRGTRSAGRWVAPPGAAMVSVDAEQVRGFGEFGVGEPVRVAGGGEGPLTGDGPGAGTAHADVREKGAGRAGRDGNGVRGAHKVVCGIAWT